MVNKNSRRFHSGTTARVPESRDTASSDVSSDVSIECEMDRSTRLAALFAVLFLLTLVIAVSFITILAIVTDGFSNLSGNTTCSPDSSNVSKSPVSLNQSDSVCLSPDCIRLASKYLDGMDREISPCDDFYEFACGRFASQHVVPEHEKKVTVLSEMKKDLDRKLRDILEKPPRENSTRAMKLTQIYFDSCMDEGAQNELGVLPLTSLISHLGGWELLTNARFDSTDYNWETLQSQLILHGVDGLVKIFVHNSFENSQKQLLMFAPPKLFLEKKKYYRESPSSNQYLNHYKKYILGLLELLGVDMEDDSGVIEYQVNDIIDMERKIANLTKVESTRNHSAISNRMTFGQMKRRFSQINWEVILNSDVRGHLKGISDASEVNVVDPVYLDGLSQLIKAKPLSSINNFMMWRLVSSLNPYLPPRFRKPFNEFQGRMHGASNEVPLWMHCVSEVKEHLSTPLSTAYATKFFSLESKARAEEMIVDLKVSMEQTLLNADWIDEETRQAALYKLMKMGHKIGFPDMLMNETAVLLPYAGVRLTANRYFDNAITLKKTEVRENLSKMHRPPSGDQWPSPVAAVDAFHYFTGNEIIFPAGILQFPMFVPDAPAYVNYGAIGMGIGHELSHGYDDLGSQYDADGNLRGWWRPETLATFQQKKQCFISQYGNKIEPTTERRIDGRLTIGENIADNGGLRVAYQAYLMKLARGQETRSLPGFEEFDDQQLFFIAYANTWCEALKPSSIEYLIDTDVHALGMFRVNVPLSNFPSFAKAFECPIGSAMNPFEKCRIW